MTTISNNKNNPIYLKSVNYGEQISYQLHNSFTNGISDGDVLLISDNGNLNAHQSILSCSPLLRVLFESMGMEQSIFYDRAYYTVYLPSFNVLSVKALLQFLYTGEVELTSGSATTSEFSELCKVLKINPPVNKYRKYTSKKTNHTKTVAGLHSVEENQETSEKNKEKYDPVLCDEMSQHKNRLEIHETQSAVNNNQSNLLSTTTDTTPMSHPPSSKTYSCNICNKKFDVQSKLRFHHMKKHNMKNETEYDKSNYVDDDKITSRQHGRETDLSNAHSSPKCNERHQKKRDKMKDQQEIERASQEKVEKLCNVGPKTAKKGVIVELNESKPSIELEHQGDEQVKDKVYATIIPKPKNMDKNSKMEVSIPNDSPNLAEDPKETRNKVSEETKDSILNSTEYVEVKTEEAANANSIQNCEDNHHDELSNAEEDGIKQDISLESCEENQELGHENVVESLEKTSGLSKEESNDEEEFKMPDNFDLPDEFLFSIKHSSRTTVPNVEPASKAVRCSGVSTCDSSSRLSPEHKLVTEGKMAKLDVQSNEQRISKTSGLSGNSLLKENSSQKVSTNQNNEHQDKKTNEHSPVLEENKRNINLSTSQQLLKTVESFSGGLTQDLPSIKQKKRVSSISDEKIKKPREGGTNEGSKERKKHKSVEDELAEKRSRMVGVFKREDGHKFDKKDIGKTEIIRSLKRRSSHSYHRKNKHSMKKKYKPLISVDPGHVCSSACPANHWMIEDQEWIENDASSEEKDNAWFPDYSSDTSVTTNGSSSPHDDIDIHVKDKKGPGKTYDHHKSSKKRIKVMMLQNSFSSTESEESEDEGNPGEREKISPNKPRKLRMMERSRKRWHRFFNKENKKACVSVQLEKVETIMEFSTYLASLEEESGDQSATSTNPIASTSQDVKTSSSPTKDKKYRRIKLFDSSSSSSETETDVENSRHHHQRKYVSDGGNVSPKRNSLDNLKSKSTSQDSFCNDELQSNKRPEILHHGKHSTSSHMKHGGGKHSSAHHERKKHPSIDESHHSRAPKEHSHSMSTSYKKPSVFQRSHSYIPSYSYKKAIDPSKYNRKLEQESSIRFSYGLSSENKVLEEKSKSKGDDGLNKIMQMSFRKKSSKHHDSD